MDELDLLVSVTVAGFAFTVALVYRISRTLDSILDTLEAQKK